MPRPAGGLEKQRSVYAAAVAALKDPTRTRLVLVTRPQESALAEAARTYDELAGVGIRATSLVINACMPAAAGDEDLAIAVRAREIAAMDAMPAELTDLQIDVIELKPTNMIGLLPCACCSQTTVPYTKRPWRGTSRRRSPRQHGGAAAERPRRRHRARAARAS